MDSPPRHSVAKEVKRSGCEMYLRTGCDFKKWSVFLANSDAELDFCSNSKALMMLPDPKLAATRQRIIISKIGLFNALNANPIDCMSSKVPVNFKGASLVCSRESFLFLGFVSREVMHTKLSTLFKILRVKI